MERMRTGANYLIIYDNSLFYFIVLGFFLFFFLQARVNHNTPWRYRFRLADPAYMDVFLLLSAERKGKYL